MTNHRHRASRLRPGRSSLALGLVGVVAGVLFSTNATLFSQATERQPQNLQELVRAESARLETTNADVTALRADVDALLSEQAAANPETAASPELAFAAGRVAVAGPGVEVRLWDAPQVSDVPDDVRVDDLVVHQQDLEAVINALWAGGAEAVTVQGHRVTATTAIRCVGNVLLLEGSTYSPPYEVAAIGDQDELVSGLMSSQPVQIYLQYVDAVRLGWSLTRESKIEMPSYDGNLSVTYARVPGDEPITLNPAGTADQGDPNGTA